MIAKGLFTQIIMLVVSVTIIVTFIQPKFVEITEVQDNIATYQQKRSEVLSVNSRLASLTSSLESVSSDDQRKLFDYLPDKVDSISVVRDLYLITNQAGLFYNDASFSGPNKSSANTKSENAYGDPEPYSFSLSVEGTYEQIKVLFALLESNNYPLEVRDLSLTKKEGGFLSADINLVTYAYDTTVNELDDRI
jgi:hypothetical protein